MYFGINCIIYFLDGWSWVLFDYVDFCIFLFLFILLVYVYRDKEFVFVLCNFFVRGDVVLLGFGYFVLV